MGVTVEDGNNNVSRIDCLRTVPASVRFLSIEPLLGPYPQSQTGWYRLGDRRRRIRTRGQSDEAGVGCFDIRDQCLRNRVPFFFKQWGGTQKKEEW